MKALRAYTINFASLANGLHGFDYQIDKKFLENFKESLVQSANIAVALTMNKTVHCLELDFKLSGTVHTTCDVCAEDFDLQLEGEEFILVKLVSEIPTENDELNVAYLKDSEHAINVAQMIYELLMLSIPMRKVHLEDETGTPSCDPKILKYLKSEEDIEAEKANNSNESTNPIWEELKKLKK